MKAQTFLMAMALCFLPGIGYSSSNMCSQVFSELTSEAQETRDFYRYKYEQFESNRKDISASRELEGFQMDSAGPTKRRAFEDLGYVFTKDAIQSPSFEAFTKNYNKILDRKGVPQSMRLQPAIVLREMYPPGGREPEYIFFIPGKDKWPESRNFTIVDPKLGEAFNLPAKVITQGLRQRRWPMLDALHDASHFASFAENPEYMMAVVKAMQTLPKMERGSSLPSRIFTNMELLALADPAKVSEIRQLLFTPETKYTNGFLPLRVFFERLEGMKDADLLAHATKVAARFDSLMKEYGAGVYHPYEKNRVLFDRTGLTTDPYVAMSNYLSDYRSRELDNLNGHTFAALVPQKMRVLLSVLDPNSGKPFKLDEFNYQTYLNENLEGARRLIFQALLDQTVMAEYILWNSSQIRVENWIAATMSSEDMDINSPAALMIRDVFSPDSYQYIKMMRAADRKKEQP